ncbi:translation initiation factor eIF-2B [Candidatus Viridilinea mediisalina]|uniref:Initiation factor 2B n=1 Tax=Candidatus Viridilinea mediisalina TaxID=2024553 RepID=A0A2A6RKL2_9CHLR|nr:initiation factor 2B [Candidatus Viridilinea mediisalina]PDW03654.1 initiation factor 2B [Candidatus Viridilinea mediisalina]
MDKLTAQKLAAIVDDNVAGAVEIAEQSAKLLLQVAQANAMLPREDLREALLAVGWTLIRAHPTMAPLVNLINGMLWKLDDAHQQRNACQAAMEAIGEFQRRLHVHEAAIAETTLRLIPEHSLIVTIGRSITVRAALRHALRAGRHLRVICAEGRPACEGRSMAAELAEAGLAVTLVIDALALSFVAEARLVLVGADHLTSRGLVNKVGTYGLALAAGAAGVPIYALCGSEKFLPPGYTPPAQAQWPAEQVWANAPTNLKITNLYFDTTPLNALAGIVTEQGVQPTVGIEAWLAATHLHPALRR